MEPRPDPPSCCSTVKPDPPEAVRLSPLPGRQLQVRWEPPRSWPFPEVFSLKYWIRYRRQGASRFRQVRTRGTREAGGTWALALSLGPLGCKWSCPASPRLVSTQNQKQGLNKWEGAQGHSSDTHSQRRDSPCPRADEGHPVWASAPGALAALREDDCWDGVPARGHSWLHHAQGLRGPQGTAAAQL